MEIYFPIDTQFNIRDTAIVIFRECGKGEGYNPNDDGRKRYEAIMTNDPKDDNYFEVINYKRVMGEFFEDFYFTCKFRAKVISEDGKVKNITSGRFDVKIDRWLKGGG